MSKQIQNKETWFDLNRVPVSQSDIDSIRRSLRSAHFSHLNLVVAIVVLSAGLTVRTVALGYDHALEILHLGIYVGSAFGIFAGLWGGETNLGRLRSMGIGILICCSSSLAASMLITLMMGEAVVWISGVSILASALASMWLLTYYDEVIAQLHLLKNVDREQFSYIKKASESFELLSDYIENLRRQGRLPLIGEYWAFREWIEERARR